MSRKRSNRNYHPQIFLCIAIIVLAMAIGAILLFRSLFEKPELPGNDDPTPGVQQPADPTPGTPEDPTPGTTDEPVAPERTNIRKTDFYTILLSGVDNGNGGADTNILVGFDAKEGSVHCVSIPRDSGFYVKGDSHKINYAYNTGGMNLLSETVSSGLGIPVDYTVQVDLNGFVQLIEAIGGVEFNVPIDMDYDDPYQDLSIHLKKCLQKLDGQNALNVVRFRHNNDGTGYGNEDLGRIATQQAFLKAVAKQTLQLSNIDKVSEFVRIFNKNVKTDLSMGNMAWLGKEAINMGIDKITFSTLPGEWSNGLSLYLLDHDAILDLVNNSLNPYMEDRIASDLNLVGG